MASPSRVVVTADPGAAPRGLVGSGIAPARTLTRARILLKADHGEADHGEGGPGWSAADAAGALDVNAGTVARVRRQVVTAGLTATLERKRPDRVSARALDGDQEARLVAVACAATPDGADRGSLRLREPAAAGRRAGAAGGGAGGLA